MFGVNDLGGVISRYADELRSATRSRRLLVGCLVWTSDKYGIGRLVNLSGDRATVSFFHSITEREELQYALNKLSRAQLSPQTRTYMLVNDGEWHMGHVGVNP